MRALGLSLTLAVAVSACATVPTPVAVAPPAAPPSEPAPPTLDGAWALAMVRDAPVGAKLSASLRIEADHAQGVTACRTWTAAAPNIGMDLRFDAMQQQETACDGAMKAIEDRYVQALGEVRTVQMRAGYLILSDARGRERLYFARGS